MTRQKYNAHRTTVDGHTFASTREAERYSELRLLEQAGAITDLKLQPRFLLQPGFKHQGEKIRPVYYVGDFAYVEGKRFIVEDVKGFKTPEYKLKRKMFLFAYRGTYVHREIT